MVVYTEMAAYQPLAAINIITNGSCHDHWFHKSLVTKKG